MHMYETWNISRGCGVSCHTSGPSYRLPGMTAVSTTTSSAAAQLICRHRLRQVCMHKATPVADYCGRVAKRRLEMAVVITPRIVSGQSDRIFQQQPGSTGSQDRGCSKTCCTTGRGMWHSCAVTIHHSGRILACTELVGTSAAPNEQNANEEGTATQ